MDQRETGEKVERDAVSLVAAKLGGNWSNGSNAGSRCSKWNNYPWNSNNNIGARGACDDKSASGSVKAGRGDHVCGQPVSTCFGEYIAGSAKRRVVKYRKSKAAIYG